MARKKKEDGTAEDTKKIKDELTTEAKDELTTEAKDELTTEAKDELATEVVTCGHCEDVHIPKKEAYEIREMFHQAMRRSDDVSFRRQLKHFMAVLDKTLD